MTIDLVTRVEDIPQIRGRWDELALHAARDGCFRTSAWYEAWMKHIRPGATPFIVVARDATGSIVGLAPLCRVTYRDLGFRISAISWGGREVVSGDFLDVLTESAVRREVTIEILEFLWIRRSEWGLMVMGELPDDSPSHGALALMADRHGLQTRRQEERVCPYIELPATFEGYLNSLGSSSRYHIRRRSRDVEKRGAHVEIYSTPEEVAGHLDTLCRLHLARWRKENLPGTLGRPGMAAFLREICMSREAAMGARLYVLTQEGIPAAALLTFSLGQTMFYYQAGWDPDSPLSSFSPAAVVMARSVQDAIALGMRHYEFLRGDEAYKSRWTKTYRTTATLLFARTLTAKSYLQVASVKDRVKRLFQRYGPVAPPASQSVDPTDRHDLVKPINP